MDKETAFEVAQRLFEHEIMRALKDGWSIVPLDLSSKPPFRLVTLVKAGTAARELRLCPHHVKNTDTEDGYQVELCGGFHKEQVLGVIKHDVDSE